jgi:hypothetical protein
MATSISGLRSGTALDTSLPLTGLAGGPTGPAPKGRPTLGRSRPAA